MGTRPLRNFSAQPHPTTLRRPDTDIVMSQHPSSRTMVVATAAVTPTTTATSSAVRMMQPQHRWQQQNRYNVAPGRYHPHHPQDPRDPTSSLRRIVSPIVQSSAPSPSPPRTYSTPSSSRRTTAVSSAALGSTSAVSRTSGGVAVVTAGGGPAGGGGASSSLTTKDSTQSLSAGSTASIDSFVNLFLLNDDDEFQRPLGTQKANNDDSNSSSISFDPYLSRRRKPSWAASDKSAPSSTKNGAVAVAARARPAAPAAGVRPAISPVRIGGGDMRKLYVPQRRPQQPQQHRGGGPRAVGADEVDFVRNQRDIALQLEQLSVSHDAEEEQHQLASRWGRTHDREAHSHRGIGSDEDDDDQDDDFPHAPLHSSFFTAESLARQLRGDDDDDEEDDDDDSFDDDATDEQGFPRHLTSIPTPTMTKISMRANRQASLLDVASSSVASWAEAEDSTADEDPHPSKASSYSSAKTADAGVHSLPSSKANDSENDRRAIQTVLYWRHIVSLRGQTAPRWVTASTLEATAEGTSSAAAAMRRATNRPSVASAKAHVQLGNALLAIQEYAEACKAFQAAYRIFGAQPHAARRHILGMATCMERMGVATALATDPIQVGVSEPRPQQPQPQPQSIHDHVQNDPTFAMLVRAYTVQLEAFRLRSIHLGSHHADVITGLTHIAKLHCHNRDWVTALQCLWQVYWARTAVFGPVHPSCGVAAHDVANVFGQLKMFDDAVNFYSIARHVYDTLNLPDHNPALRKLNRDVRRLERLEHRQGYNVL